MWSPCCLGIPPINFWMAEPVFMQLGMYIMAPEPISTAYFINPCHQSVCLYVYLFIVARQRLGKNVSAATNTRRYNRRIVGRVVFCADRVLSKESRRLVLPRTYCYFIGQIPFVLPKHWYPPAEPHCAITQHTTNKFMFSCSHIVGYFTNHCRRLLIKKGKPDFVLMLSVVCVLHAIQFCTTFIQLVYEICQC
jgi:hypothetical protein